MIYAFCRTSEHIWQNPLISPFTDDTLLSIILEQLLFVESKKNYWNIYKEVLDVSNKKEYICQPESGHLKDDHFSAEKRANKHN